MNAVLVAAGYGTRIRSLFPDTPKALIEVAGRALIDHLLANLARSGAVESALVVTNDRYHDALRDHLAARAPPLPTRVISDGTSSEDERLGALGDVQLALRRLDRAGDVLVRPPASCSPSTCGAAAPRRAAQLLAEVLTRGGGNAHVGVVSVGLGRLEVSAARSQCTSRS